jgi:hypothetical protein
LDNRAIEWRDVTIGDVTYRLHALARDGEWVAHAEASSTGDRFGIECVGTTRDAAIGRLTVWLTWQTEHAAALDALQRAERAYHRSAGERASTTRSDGSTAIDVRHESLEDIDTARVRLDEVRARRPE